MLLGIEWIVLFSYFLTTLAICFNVGLGRKMTTHRQWLVITLLWSTATTICWAFQQTRTTSRVSRTDVPDASTRIRHIRTSISSTWHSRVRAVNNHAKFLNEHYESTSYSDSFRVGIAGAGAVAFATATILSRNGHGVMLWSPSGNGTKDLQAPTATSDNQPVRIESSRETMLTASGSIEYKFVPRIATSSEQLVKENDVLLVCLPANGHKHVFDELAPHLSTSVSHKHVIISSHASLGALYLTQAIEEHQQHNKNNHLANVDSLFPTITAWGTTVCTARRPSGTSVDVKSIRKSVDLCTVPEQESSSALTLCQWLFPGINFQRRDGLLAISLSNLNPQNHLGMALGNISRMDKGEAWYQFLMTTPSIGRFLQDLDQERLNIASALGLDVKTIQEHFSLSFHVPISESISDMCQEIYKSGNDVYGPNTASSRYITEDVPFGLVLTATLGRMVNRPALLHESGIFICNSMYGCDFVAKNDLLQALKIDEMTMDDLQRVVRTGRTRIHKQPVPSTFVK
jgi:opine dehydrogenase